VDISNYLLEVKILQNCITILPGDSQNDTTTAQQHDRDDGYDESGVAFLGFLGDWGHLIVHNYFSSYQ